MTVKDLIKNANRTDHAMQKWKKWLRQPKPMPENIYDDKYLEDHYKKFHKVHFVFKYKFVLPIAWLAKKILGKSLKTEVPDKPWNAHLKIFNDAWDLATKKWASYYLRPYDGENERFHSKKLQISNLKKAQRDIASGQWTLKTVKELFLTGALYDTVYREWVRIFMDEITAAMIHHVKTSPAKSVQEREDAATTQNIHLFWTDSDIYDTNYFAFYRNMKDGKVFIKDHSQNHFEKQQVIDAIKKARESNVCHPCDTMLAELDLELEVDDDPKKATTSNIPEHSRKPGSAFGRNRNDKENSGRPSAGRPEQALQGIKKPGTGVQGARESKA